MSGTAASFFLVGLAIFQGFFVVLFLHDYLTRRRLSDLMGVFVFGSAWLALTIAAGVCLGSAALPQVHS